MGDFEFELFFWVGERSGGRKLGRRRRDWRVFGIVDRSVWDGKGRAIGVASSIY